MSEKKWELSGGGVGESMAELNEGISDELQREAGSGGRRN